MNAAQVAGVPEGTAVGDARKAMLYMAGFVALWAGIEFIAAKPLQDFSPYQVVWTRYAVHLLLMLAVWGRRDPARLWRTGRRGYHLARSLLMLGMPASWVLALQTGVAPDAIMHVFWTSPLLMLALAWLLLRERPGPPVWIATSVAMAGAYLLHRPGGLDTMRVLGFPLAMALSFSLYVVMTRSLRSEPTLVNLFYTALGVFLALTPAVPQLWRTPGLLEALTMVCIGVFGWLTLWMLDRAVAEAPVSVSAPVIYLQPLVVAAIVVSGGLGIGVSPKRLAVGTMLIGGAVVYLLLRAQRVVHFAARPAYAGSRPSQES